MNTRNRTQETFCLVITSFTETPVPYHFILCLELLGSNTPPPSQCSKSLNVYIIDQYKFLDKMLSSVWLSFLILGIFNKTHLSLQE